MGLLTGLEVLQDVLLWHEMSRHRGSEFRTDAGVA
jgi:hypothetical protein